MNQLRFVRHNIYKLKRNYGLSIDLYHITEIVQDLKTGRKTVDKIRYHIKRAILLPTELQTELLKNTPYLRADRGYSETTLNIYDKLIIIDNRDLPKDYIFNTKDYIVLEGLKYNINKVTVMEHGQATLFKVKAVSGSELNQVLTETAENQLRLLQDAND